MRTASFRICATDVTFCGDFSIGRILAYLRVPMVFLFPIASFPVISFFAVSTRVTRPAAEYCVALQSSSKAAKENP